MISCRAMTWKESCAYDDFVNDLLEKNPEIKQSAFLQKTADYIFTMIYHADVEDYRLGEVKAVVERTVELSNEIREDEIKNLKPGSSGRENAPAIAKTAEK